MQGSANWQEIAEGELANKEGVAKEELRLADFVYVGHDPRLIVIGDAIEVSSLKDRVTTSQLERIAEVDFSNYFVAVIHQGLRNRPYHPIEVSSVEFENNVFTIHAQLYEPDRSTYEPMPVNSPYYVLEIEKPTGVREEDISFVLEANGERIPQICAIEGEPLSWGKMVYEAGGAVGMRYEGVSPRLTVVADREAISSIEGEIYPEHVELIANVDFSTHFVVVIYQGLKRMTDYSVEAISVKRQDDTVVVCAQFHEPSGGGAAEISPYYVLQVERPEDLQGDLTFVLVANGEEVARQEAVIP